MSETRVPIVIPTKPLARVEIDAFRANPFPEMIKFVVDISQRRIALGGEMHADAELVLLESGSQQSDLWGGNLWPWAVPPHVEYISLINIRPSVDNNGMEIASDDIRRSVDEIVRSWVSI